MTILFLSHECAPGSLTFPPASASKRWKATYPPQREKGRGPRWLGARFTNDQCDDGHELPKTV